MRPRCWCLISFTQLKGNFGSVATGPPTTARQVRENPKFDSKAKCFRFLAGVFWAASGGCYGAYAKVLAVALGTFSGATTALAQFILV